VTLDDAIVPVENSLEGAVTVVMDLLLHLKVTSPAKWNLSHQGFCLVDAVKRNQRLFFHPQPLASAGIPEENFSPSGDQDNGLHQPRRPMAQEFPEMAAVAEGHR